MKEQDRAHLNSSRRHTPACRRFKTARTASAPSRFGVLLFIFLTCAYRRSCSSLLFPMIQRHTSFNVMVNFQPPSAVGLLIRSALTAAAVVIDGKVWQKPRPNPPG